MFTVSIKRKAFRKLEELDERRRQLVREIIVLLKDDPVPFKRADVTKLAGYQDTYRIRVGQLRIVYSVSWKERKITIHYIGPREKAYE
ncbi:hypothetical protein HRbin03_00429 [archaeon HR03]|nr:hypothetical protein HRbin03_00429 [archaeon HR03]